MKFYIHLREKSQKSFHSHSFEINEKETLTISDLIKKMLAHFKIVINCENDNLINNRQQIWRHYHYFLT